MNIYFQKITLWLEKFCMPIIILIMRLWIAKVFFNSGLAKIADWPATLSLFAQEYQVPLIPPEIAAYLASAVELSCPVLLVIGLATRFATIPLLIMTGVIQLTYPGYIEHAYWAILLFTILCYGPGTWSCDHLIKREMQKVDRLNTK